MRFRSFKTQWTGLIQDVSSYGFCEKNDRYILATEMYLNLITKFGIFGSVSSDYLSYNTTTYISVFSIMYSTFIGWTRTFWVFRLAQADKALFVQSPSTANPQRKRPHEAYTSNQIRSKEWKVMPCSGQWRPYTKHAYSLTAQLQKCLSLSLSSLSLSLSLSLSQCKQGILRFKRT